MNTAALPTNTLAKTLLPIDNAVVRNLILAIVGSLALWVSAKLSIPFWPVPLTMQTLVVLVIGMAFGARLGAATVLLYLAEGAVGLPVFSGTPEKGIGLAYMMSTTGGYLVGFVLAAGAVGFLAERGWDRSPVKTALAMVLLTLVVQLLALVVVTAPVPLLSVLVSWSRWRC